MVYRPPGLGPGPTPLRGEAHVWSVREEGVDDEDDRVLRGLLLPDEVARAARFRFAGHRRQYLVARALARVAPSFYADVSPRRWRFERDARGKPEIVDPPPRLRHSLCHTEGLVAVAITDGVEVGLDAENTGRTLEDPGALAERHFASSEAAAIRDLPAGERRDHFLRLWTLKEALAKARGSGLSPPLDDPVLSLRVDGEVVATFDPRRGEVGEHWQLFSIDVPPSHRLGLAIRHGGLGPLVVRHRHLDLSDLVTAVRSAPE